MTKTQELERLEQLLAKTHGGAKKPIVDRVNVLKLEIYTDSKCEQLETR